MATQRSAPARTASERRSSSPFAGGGGRWRGVHRGLEAGGGGRGAGGGGGGVDADGVLAHEAAVRAHESERSGVGPGPPHGLGDRVHGVVAAGAAEERQAAGKREAARVVGRQA